MIHHGCSSSDVYNLVKPFYFWLDGLAFDDQRLALLLSSEIQFPQLKAYPSGVDRLSGMTSKVSEFISVSLGKPLIFLAPPLEELYVFNSH